MAQKALAKNRQTVVMAKKKKKKHSGSRTRSDWKIATTRGERKQ